MIKDEQEYAVSQDALQRFEASLQKLSLATSPGDSPTLHHAELEGMQVQISRLKREIAEYDTLKQGDTHLMVAASLEELPRLLIQARIALGLSRRELAARLGSSEEAVEQDEDEEYATSPVTRLAEVAAALGLRTREELYLPISG